MKKYLITLTFLLAAALFAVPATAAIVSDFTYTIDPSDPLTIHFTEKSTGGAGNWFWMFNDGGKVETSTERNPTYTFSGEGTYMVSCAAQSPDYSEEDTMRKQLTITLSGVTDDSGGSGSSSGGSSSSGGDSGGGISLPDISLGGISIPNPLDIIGEYIKLIRVMIIPSNYNI